MAAGALLSVDRSLGMHADYTRLSAPVVDYFIAIQSQRADRVQLEANLTELRSILDSGGAVGKRLDFLMQELNREANTTLSKSTDLTIKEAGLAIKAEVEKLREQVQNVE